MDPTASPPPTTTSSGGYDLPDHPGPKDPTTAATTSSGGDDLSDHLGPRDSTTILKGKRTKRQRPTTTATATTTIVSHSPNSSPTSSSDHFPPDTTTATATAEDHDTANSLILLSQGQHVSNNNNNNNNNNNSNNNNINSSNIEELSGYKFNSKRYIQMSADGVNGINGGIYVYECKTCSRTFPSFQALGGHRASHKKPRVNEPEKRKPPHYTAVSDDDDPSLPQFQRKNNNSSSSSSLSLQLTRNTKKYSSSKLHDCAICGAEFNSGQALGGHMRRHRAANGSTTNMTNAGNVSSNTNTTLSLIPYSPVNQKSINDGLCLDLDLNLPAPPEMSNQDQHRDSSFKFTANPTHTLVDCHY